MKLRPSEMLVSFLMHLQESGFRELYYQNGSVESVEQIEYDKFVIRIHDYHDKEIRCDGIMVSEFLRIVSDFSIR